MSPDQSPQKRPILKGGKGYLRVGQKQMFVEHDPTPYILVTGATGYIGGRLVPRLLDNGYKVRVLVRDRSRLEGRLWLPRVDIAEADVLLPETLPRALEGVKAAYYLVHSMGPYKDFDRRDEFAAYAFGEAAREAGVERIIYLGGLGDPDSPLSKHLNSRHETGNALRMSGLPVTEFRAAIVVGSGSVSFELIRDLTEHLPVMLCPKWVNTRVQPISMRDVQSYLVAALAVRESAGQIVEIGGADILTFFDMMAEYARARDLKRLMVKVPVLTPRLCSYWVHWMTPIPPGIARPLIEGLRNEVVVRSDTAQKLFPTIRPMNYATALHLAIGHMAEGQVETSWSDALWTSAGDATPVKLTDREGIIVEQRVLDVNAGPHHVYKTFTGLGGDRGWLYLNSLWRMRGVIDRLVGGVGFRRGRRDPDALHAGDAVDFWRVEDAQPDRLLRLRAEMRVPGRAWIEFETVQIAGGKTRLTQTALFVPKGLFGHLYWYLLYPIHGRMFSGLIHAIAVRAERAARAEL